MADLKKSDRPITAELSRAGVGLRIRVRCHPIIEEFFQGCQGMTTPIIDNVADFGRRMWEPTRGDSRRELQVYGIPRELQGEFAINNIRYRLDRPGDAIFLPSGLDGGALVRGAKVLNLSFLRLVGTSSEDGVPFYISGVYSEDTMNELEAAITAASQEIYRQFMKPIRIEIVLEVRDSGSDATRIVEVPSPAELNADSVNANPVQAEAA